MKDPGGGVLHKSPEPCLALPDPPFGLMLEQGHLDGGDELPTVDGFVEVTEGLGQFRPLKGVFLCMDGDIDHRDVKFLADAPGGLDAVHPPLELDIEEYDGRGPLPCEPERILTGGYHPGYPVSGIREDPADALRNGDVILDNEH